jgi:hypothetical protein
MSSLLADQEKEIGIALWRFFCFLLGVAPLLVAVHLWYGVAAINPFDHKFMDFEAVAAEIELVILGNSQMYFGVPPDEFDVRAFNLAYNNQDLYSDGAILKRYRGRMGKLQTVIWGISWFSPFSERDSLLYYRYLHSHRESRSLKKRAIASINFLRLRAARPIEDSFQLWWASMERLWGKTSSPLVSGWVPGSPVGESLGDALRTVRTHEGYCRFDLADQNARLMIETIRELHNRGVRVVIVTPPLAKQYISAFSPKIRKRYQGFINRLIRRTNVEYIDCHNLIPSGQKYFFDSDHLQLSGVRLFARHLNSILKNEQSETH